MSELCGFILYVLMVNKHRELLAHADRGKGPEMESLRI